MPTSPEPLQLCELELRKRATFIEVFVKSSAIEEYFRAISNGRATGNSNQPAPFNIPQYQLSEAAMAPLNELSLGTFTSWGRTDLFYNGKVNLSFLLAGGLTDGVTFRMNTPISPRLQRDFLEKFDNAVGEFYDHFLRPEDARASITVVEEMVASR